jgi:aconitate decarboxylase
VTTTNIPN